MEKKKDNVVATVLQILSISMMAGMGTMINPIMQKLIDMYPAVPVATVRMLSTICSLLGICVSLPLSALFGKKLKFKPIMMLSAVLTMCGALPLLFDPVPFWSIMLSRVLVGVGFGLVTLRNACIRKMFAGDDAKIALWIGLTNCIVNIMSSALQPISGLLGDVDIKYTFWLYFIAVVPLILNILFFKEPESAIEEVNEGTKAPRGKINPKIFLFSAIVIFGTLISFPIFTGMATLITSRGIGEAAISGTVTSMYSVGSMIGSLAYPIQNKTFKRMGIALDMFALALGFGLIVLAQNVFVAIVGAFLCGVGFTCFSLSFVKFAGDVSDDSTRTFASTLLTTSISIGSFFSSYWINAANKIGSVFTFLPTDAERTYMVGTILYVVLGIVFTLVNVYPKETQK